MTQATAEKTADVEITELEKIEPTRVDGVKSAANGFPILMMKSLEETAAAAPADDGRGVALELVKAVLDGGLTAPVLAKDADGYDESADITGALDVIAKISSLVCSEATALGTGRMEEAYDISCLMQAVGAMQAFLCREQQQDNGSADDVMTPLAQSAADSDDDPGALIKGKYTAEQKRKMLADGHAIANDKGAPSYPIGDKEDLDKAINAVGAGGTEHNAIRRHVIASAKRLGASDMIPDTWNSDGSLKTSKALASENDPTAPVVDITETVEKAVAKAMAAAEGRAKALEAEIARLQQMPVPGGPMLLRPQDIPSTQVTKSDRYKALALAATDGSVRAAYNALAKAEEAE